MPRQGPIGAPFAQARELQRVVNVECMVELDSNRYSAPWWLIRAEVTVVVDSGFVRILHLGQEVARHAELPGRLRRSRDPRHFEGLSGGGFGRSEPQKPALVGVAAVERESSRESELDRPLAEYELCAGGGW